MRKGERYQRTSQQTRSVEMKKTGLAGVHDDSVIRKLWIVLTTLWLISKYPRARVGSLTGRGRNGRTQERSLGEIKTAVIETNLKASRVSSWSTEYETIEKLLTWRQGEIPVTEIYVKSEA
jgi:hypothetical protein